MRCLGIVFASVLAQACAVDLIEPAADPGDYELIDPEIVVVSQTLQHLAIDHEEDAELQRIGVHLGHGLFVDIDGNVSAIPQLLASTGDDFAWASPDTAAIGGVFPDRLEGDEDGYTLARTGGPDRTFRALPTGWSLEGARSRRPLLTVERDGDRTTVSTYGRERLHVQSQGDHLLVQHARFRDQTEIRHGADGADSTWYELDRVGLGGPVTTALTTADRTLFAGGGTRASYTRQLDDEGQDALVRRAFLGQTTTTRTDDGWVEGALFRTTVTVARGRSVAGR